MTAPSGSVSVIGSVAPVRFGSEVPDPRLPPNVTVRHFIAFFDSERDDQRIAIADEGDQTWQASHRYTGLLPSRIFETTSRHRRHASPSRS